MNTITPNLTADGGQSEGVVTPTSIPTTNETEQTATVKTEQVVHDNADYRAKFIASAKGAQALLEEKKQLEARLAELESNRAAGISTNGLTHRSPDTEVLYPGFENLDPEAQENLAAYTNAVMNKTKEAIYQDPAIAFAQKNYAESKWEAAFAEAVSQFPELAEAKDQFKADYFNPKNVPDNIDDILKTMAKSYLFDKARDIGAQEGRMVAERVQLESPTGGDKTPSVHRSLEDWNRLAQQNPAQFATMKKEYEADIASGKLKE